MKDVLFLKENLHIQFLEPPEHFHRIHGIPREPADGLCEDQVDLSGLAVLHHLQELCPLLHAGAGDSAIGCRV